MKRVKQQMKDIKIAYIGGGSRGWAWNIMVDLAMENKLSGEVKLYDIDMQAAIANETIGNKISNLENANKNWKYSVSETLKDALVGSDFVIISILPGTFKEMFSDVHEPEKYGIYQSVGDTVGPGGLIRSLRTIPMMEVIGKAISEFAPEAWVINYTNPMTVCIQTLYKVFPEIKAFGCCHEVFGTQKLLAQALADIEDIQDVDRREIDVNVLGINHFTWIDKASYQNIDLFPLYEKFVEKYYDTGFTKDSDTNWMNNSFKSAQRVKFDLFKRYGLIAAAGDRHLAEFMPPWYLKDPQTVKDWMFGLTTVDFRIEQLNERIEKSKRLVSGEENPEFTPFGEEGIDLIKALCGLGEFKSNVNIPNVGQISNIPLGTIVETNALFAFNKITPMMAGEVPVDILALMMPHILNQGLIVKAGLTKDKVLAYRAFCNEPLVNLSPEQSKELFDSMMNNTKEYLDGWNF